MTTFTGGQPAQGASATGSGQEKGMCRAADSMKGNGRHAHLGKRDCRPVMLPLGRMPIEAMPVAVLLLLVLFGLQAHAGKRVATFRASLVIDTALLERDLARRGITTAPTTSTTRASGREASATAATTLRRADGSGSCVKMRLADGRVRWRCD